MCHRLREIYPRTDRWLQYTDLRSGAPGGGGKRDAHSFEHYNRDTGVSVYTAPSVKPGEYFTYYDPIDRLSPESQARWKDPAEQARMIKTALEQARSNPS